MQPARHAAATMNAQSPSDLLDQARGNLYLSENDKQMLYFMAAYTVGIFVLWNMPVLKHLLYPFKLVVTALHEFGHAAAGKCTGARIESIKIDADTGGVTRMRGGNPRCTLPAGYIGSSFFGGLMIFSAFNVIASKVVAILVGICFLITLYLASNWIARVISILYIGAIGVLFWYSNGFILPYVVLFIGVMCSLQSLWDFQGLIFHKHPESDATKFAEVCGCCPSQVWGAVWMLISLILMAGFTLLAIVSLK